MGLDPEMLRSDIERHAGTLREHISSAQEILDRLLGSISRVDFHQLAGKEETARIPKNCYVVLIIDHILDECKRQGWPLALKNSTIFIYNGRVWVPVQVGKFKRFLQQAAQKMGMPHNDVGHFSYQEDLYKQFMSAAAIPSPDRPSGVVAINLQNGTFEFSERGHGLREFRQEDFLTHQLPFSYNDNAGCPLFMSFLDRNLPDKDSQAVIAEYIGYVFLRTLRLEKVLMLYGDGANGKSVLFNIILALLGRENVCSYSLEKLTGPDPQYRAGLENKLLNYATEISGRVDSAVFKQLISGEPIEARVLYSSAYIMDSYARLMFNCNVLPAATERTTAYFRRFLIVPFSVTIPESEQDPELAEAFRENDTKAFINRKRALKKELFRVVGEQTGHLFDPDVLTIVWSRRFAAYKRPALITENPVMFERMLQRTNRPVQMIWAGKPYPTDFAAVDIFNKLNRLSEKQPRCAVLTGYELGLSRLLKNGSDLWLNNPVVTREASGTSGMSATMNGSITISTNDGWVREFEKDGENCFIIPEAKEGLAPEARDRSDRDNFYNLLESKVLPLYYDDKDGWMKLVFNAMKDICPAFDSDRMADEYYVKMYNEEA